MLEMLSMRNRKGSLIYPEFNPSLYENGGSRLGDLKWYINGTNGSAKWRTYIDYVDTPYGMDYVSTSETIGLNGTETNSVGVIYKGDRFFNLDKPIRISMWVYKYQATSANYLGSFPPRSSWKNYETNEIKTDTTEFYTNINNSIFSEWILMVGYIHPYGTTNPPLDQRSTAYRMDGSKVTSGVNNLTYIALTANVPINFTTLAHYGRTAQPSDRSDLYHPRLDICDGSEPTIHDLLTRKCL